MAGSKTGSVRLAPIALFTLAALAAPAPQAAAQTIEQLRNLSIEELAAVQVSSVAKSSQPLSDAPAAIYVISHDDVVRAGARTLPEMLRLAPNLEVAQLSPSTYAITARGFNVFNNASQPNKLLVLIDGRTVYSPLYGGVFWDMQQVSPENLERIEVISGPGGTLWGANAVNGVINVITRGSAQAQGGSVGIGGGNTGYGADFQYGGRIDENLTYAVHAEGSRFYGFKRADGSKAHDGWSDPQGGFRLDWTPDQDAISLSGEISNQQEALNDVVGGGDVTASWRHNMADGSSFQLLTYFDRMKRYAGSGQGGFGVDTYDVEAQHNLSLLGWNDIVWGAGARFFSYSIENTALQLVPDHRDLHYVDIFAQDTIALSDRLKLILGLKLEDEPYSGVEPMPNARLAWKATDKLLLWMAASRAVRSPTPIDEDLREYFGGRDIFNGSPQFRPELITAYEGGARVEIGSFADLSASLFYNDYSDLRSLEFAPPGSASLVVWGNHVGGDSYGAELWADAHVASWWRLRAGFNSLRENLDIRTPGEIGGLGFIADDPAYQASLRSSMDLTDDVAFDAALRRVGPLHHPAVPGYTEMDLRLAWAATPNLELSLSGTNLLHSYHLEFFETGQSDRIPRSYYLASRWRF